MKPHTLIGWAAVMTQNVRKHSNKLFLKKCRSTSGTEGKDFFIYLYLTQALQTRVGVLVHFNISLKNCYLWSVCLGREDDTAQLWNVYWSALLGHFPNLLFYLFFNEQSLDWEELGTLRGTLKEESREGNRLKIETIYIVWCMIPTGRAGRTVNKAVRLFIYSFI